MKKMCILLLVPVFLLNGSLAEAFKLPALLTHFLEHRRQDASIGPFDFLSMHYWGDDHNPSDQDRDMQLPFKKICDAGNFEIAPVPATVAVVSKRCFSPARAAVPGLRDANLPDRAPGCLFRPPQA